MPTLEQIKILERQRKEMDSHVFEAWKAYDETYSKPLPVELEKLDLGESEEDNSKDWSVARFGGVTFKRVGNGVQTNDKCGTYRTTFGCLHVELHDKTTLNGVDHKGKVSLKKLFLSCDKPSCPTCFKRGWGNLEATMAANIIKKISNGYVDVDGKKHMGLGDAEHIIGSVPKSDYVLLFEELKAKHQAVLKSRGVLGGISIFHLQRYRNYADSIKTGLPFGWYISPHFHTVGWINGGYGKCRSCSNVWLDLLDGGAHVKSTEKCMVCSVFEGCTRRAFLKEGGVFGESNGRGWIVKVKGKRKSIRSTLFYQLSHASFVCGSTRAHVATWWGVAGCRKLRLSKEDRKLSIPCDICGSEMQEVVRVGGDEQEWWVKVWEESFLNKDGIPNWAVAPKKEIFG